MRPSELEISGFRSHQEPTVIDFSGRTLLAIVGPIGAGKSTILDAICFALYGKTPKIQREPRRLICSHSDAARVRLRFSADGSAYEVERLLPRKGNGEHVLTDLASGDKTMGSTAVGEKVEELLGLSFEAFRSSILLAQGQFDEFLHATPNERTKILKGVFRFDQITALHGAARARVAVLKGELEGVLGELRGIGEDVEKRLAAERERLAGLGFVTEKLLVAVPEERELEEVLKTSADNKQSALDRDRRARAALADVPSDNELLPLTQREATTNTTVATVEDQLVAASGARGAAEKAFEALRADAGDEAALRLALAKAEELRENTNERAGLEDERARVADNLRVLHADMEAKAAAANAADEAHRLAVEKKTEAERADMAHALKGYLEAGQPCPVCERPVEDVPVHRHKPELARLKKEEKAATADAERARKNAAGASEDFQRGRLDDDRVAQEIERLGARAGKLTNDLTDSLGPQEDFVDAARMRLAALDAAADALKKVVAEAEEARAALESARGIREEVAKEKRALAAALIRLSTFADVAAPDVDCTAEELVRNASDVRASLETQIEVAGTAIAKAEETEETALGALVELRTPFDLAEGVRIETALVEARADLRNSADRVADLEKGVQRSLELKEEADGLGARTGIYQRLTEDLRDTNFVNFLLEERRRLLSELGSEVLREMTGRYRFSDDAEFDVVDELAADQRRDVETLSGGETFLASLALSLALAEAVTREGGRLESFFLDEGFGALDADAFDHALDGIERIVVEDRLIGLVSHVPALAARVEDKIVLDKTDEGTTILVSGASG